MTIHEASRKTGFSRWTLRKFIRQGEFLAAKPLGNKHGWIINDTSFCEWWQQRQHKGSNSAQVLARRVS